MFRFQIVPENKYLRVNVLSPSEVNLETGSKKIDREEKCPTVFKPGEKCFVNDFTILAIGGGKVETHRLK